MKRIIVGARGGVEGLWISKPGFDAGTATDQSSFMVMPGFALCRPFMAGIITQVAGQDTTYTGPHGIVYGYNEYGLATIKHGLGYMPVCMVFGADPNTGNRVCTSVDTTNIYASCTSLSTYGQTYTVSWPYVIFKDALP